MNNLQHVIACQSLHKNFFDGNQTIHVLRDINLQVKPREQIAIVGASGAGKSTLLHVLGGLDKPSQGIVKVNNEDIFMLSENARSELRNRVLGFVYQFHHLLPEFTALENICMPLLVRKVDPVDAKQQGLNLLEKVNLLDRQHHKPGMLSGGERQRVAIARALVTKPGCILADEPTGNLDQHTAETVFNMLLEINHSFNTSLVIVTHDLRLAAKMDRVLSLEDGMLVEKTK